MSGCEKFRDLHTRLDALSAREFAALDRHRDTCDACALQDPGEDSLAMFAELRHRRPDPVVWTGLWEGVREGLREGIAAPDRLPGSTGLSLLHPAYRVAAAVALVIGLGLLALGWMEPPVAPRVPPTPAAPGPAVATVESIRSPHARLYDMRVIGEDDQGTELVLIFDEEIDL